MTLFDLSSSEGSVEEVDRPEGARSTPVEKRPRDPSQPLRRVLLACAYDGTPFHGFAPQRGQLTVSGTLATALNSRFGVDVRLTCAGRTDTGVHALAQVVHADLPEHSLASSEGATLEPGVELPLLARSLSSQLGPEIVVWSARVATQGFDARRSAIARRYRYEIETTARADPIRAKGCWHVGAPLDVAAMRIAADMLVGTHDFGGYCRQPSSGPTSLERTVIDATLAVTEPGRLRFEIEARSFCHQMVRSIVGLLVEIGRGHRRPSEVMERLRSGSRDGSPTIAPANGLCLVAVRYPEDLGGTIA